MSVTPAKMKIVRATHRNHNGPSKMLCQNINPATTGTAAMRAKVSSLGSARGRAGNGRELMAFMSERNTRETIRSTGGSSQIPADCAWPQGLLNWRLGQAAFPGLHHESLIQ